jgi:hypothetical protein
MSSQKRRKAIGGHMDVLLGSAAEEPAAVPPRSRGRRDAAPSRQRRATYHLPDELVRKVDAICRAEGSHRGSTVAMALRSYIAGWEAKASAQVLLVYRALVGGSSRGATT